MTAERPAAKPMKSLDEALAQLLGYAARLDGVEQLATFDADGRVLAQDLVSHLHVPPQDNSSMDGYALRCADLTDPSRALPVSQRIPAGSAGTALAPQSVARIFTGAPIPAGADAVVMQEDCDVQADGSVRMTAQPKPGQWIRRAGEDVTRGAVVLA
ncbi:MAG: molybdopterin molybdenumtransferase MoeA, partial [Rhodoferax sp.]|nr:molybdopterin molybdenumtransferase MoeA [Rhodoferax sp.]